MDSCGRRTSHSDGTRLTTPLTTGNPLAKVVAGGAAGHDGVIENGGKRIRAFRRLCAEWNPL